MPTGTAPPVIAGRVYTSPMCVRAAERIQTAGVDRPAVPRYALYALADRRPPMRRTVRLTLTALLALAALPALAQDRTRLKFEKTIPYQLDKKVRLDAQVGAAHIDTVELSQPVAGSVGESIA